MLIHINSNREGKGFDSSSNFSLTDGSVGNYAIIFGANMRSSFIMIAIIKISQFSVESNTRIN